LRIFEAIYDNDNKDDHNKLAILLLLKYELIKIIFDQWQNKLAQETK